MNRDFTQSTQAKSWIFTNRSLAYCRAEAANTSRRRVRSFAAGFTSRYDPNCLCNHEAASHQISESDQSRLVQFHAHQLATTLTGPTAVLDELRCSRVVSATAVSLFRRFYLSNSVLRYEPRVMAAACGVLASKLEDEPIEVRRAVSSWWEF